MENKVRIALIPSYEPDDNLLKVVEELLDKKFKVIVVDDGSGEAYQDIFNKINAKVICYRENMGKGYALKTGLKYIKENYNNYIVVTMDSDGQHTVSDAIKLCNYVEKHDNYLVLGSRKRDKDVPLRSYLGNSITRVIYKLVTRCDIYDTQTGLRCFSDKLTNYMLSIDGNRYEYEMNVLLSIKLHNIKIKEIPIETIYIDNNKNSHFNTIKDSFKIYKEIFKFSFSSMFSFLIDYILCLLFTFITGMVAISNISARVISSLVNYNINKRVVFKSNNKNTLLKYYLLVILILILNTVILTIFNSFLNIVLAKLFTELVLFIISLKVQKKFIFKGCDNY